MVDRRVEPARTERVQRMKAAIAARLEGVCCNFPREEFDAMVERLAVLEIKYTQRAEVALAGFIRFTSSGRGV
jgi:hypothetical protein